MKTNETSKEVKPVTKSLVVDEKRATAQKNLPLIKEAIAKYAKRSD